MEQIATQWPLLAGFLALNAVFLRIIQSLYERMVKSAALDTAEALRAQKEGHDALLMQVRAELAAALRREDEWKLVAMEQRHAVRDAVSVATNSSPGGSHD